MTAKLIRTQPEFVSDILCTSDVANNGEATGNMRRPRLTWLEVADVGNSS
jgi:hypothetical protein